MRLVILPSVLAVLAAASHPCPATAHEIGTTIESSRAAELSDHVLPGVAQAVRRGMNIEVAAHRTTPWRPAYKLATEKHQGQARLAPDGTLLDYVAGLPFLHLDPNDPAIGAKIMWNHAFGPWATDDATWWSFEWQTGKLRGDRGMSVESGEHRDSEQCRWLRLVGRVDVPPLPAIPDNNDSVMKMEIFGPTFPIFLTLMRSGPLLTYRYLTTREDNLWYYTSTDRLSHRIAPKLRYEAFGDVVIDLNSAWGFNAPVVSYTWRFLGERKMLGVLHARHYPAVWCPGRGDFAPCETWEERPALVVEGTARAPYDSYGKRVIAVDKEAWVVLATDLYDRDGTFWKTWINFWSYRPYTGGGGGEVEHAYLLAGSGIDFQYEKAIRWRLPGTRPLAEAVAINTGLTPEDFSVGNLGQVFQ